MKKKIIVFHLLNNFTGSPLILRNVLELLVRNGYDVELYTSSGDGFLSKIDGIKYKSNFYIRSNFRIITFFTFFASQFFLFFALLKRLEKNNSIIYVNTILPFTAILAGNIFRIPVIVHVHEDKVHPRLLNSFLFFVTNRFSNYLILVSNYLLKNHIGTNAKTNVVYNSVSSDFSTFPKPMKNKQGTTFEVLMLASLRPYKGLSVFLEISKCLPNVNFNLVLSDTPQDVDKYFLKEYIPKNMNVFSLQKNVHIFYSNADLVVNLTDKDSVIETFGMTILEGMHYRLPVIVPIVGGITDLVEDGMNGFLFDSKEINSIVEKINCLATNQILWEKMSNRSFELKEKFSIENFENGINNVLEEAFQTFNRKKYY
jgi:glycosyltransferase involved in cell wall biosynthesis